MGISRIIHTPVIDSLDPAVQSTPSVTPTNHEQLMTAVLIAVIGLSATAAISFFLVRLWMRRTAIKHRRQASWILRSGHWNMEPKRTDTHETRTGCSDTSSSFSAYPYPIVECVGK